MESLVSLKCLFQKDVDLFLCADLQGPSDQSEYIRAMSDVYDKG